MIYLYSMLSLAAGMMCDDCPTSEDGFHVKTVGTSQYTPLEPLPCQKDVILILGLYPCLILCIAVLD